jgi:hypothetical protein
MFSLTAAGSRSPRVRSLYAVFPLPVERAGRIAESSHGRFLATASLVRLGVSPSRLVYNLPLRDNRLSVFGMVFLSPSLEGRDGNIAGQARLLKRNCQTEAGDALVETDPLVQHPLSARRQAV